MIFDTYPLPWRSPTRLKICRYCALLHATSTVPPYRSLTPTAAFRMWICYHESFGRAVPPGYALQQGLFLDLFARFPAEGMSVTKGV